MRACLWARKCVLKTPIFELRKKWTRKVPLKCLKTDLLIKKCTPENICLLRRFSMLPLRCDIFPLGFKTPHFQARRISAIVHKCTSWESFSTEAHAFARAVKKLIINRAFFCVYNSFSKIPRKSPSECLLIFMHVFGIQRNWCVIWEERLHPFLLPRDTA